MTVRDMVIKALRELGADGLMDVTGCECFLDVLMPCPWSPEDCRPAYRHSDGVMRETKEGTCQREK